MSENTTNPPDGPGGPRDASNGAGPGRLHAFAPNPSEHVLQPSVTSTLFPHLPHQRSVEFRLGLLALAAVLLLLGYFRLSGAMVAVATAGVPLLYALYLYEIEVDERKLSRSMAASAGTGALLGVGWALLTGHYVTRTLVLRALPQGVPAWRIVLVAVVFPLVTQFLMLVGPLVVLRTRPASFRGSERSSGGPLRTLDGFDFGAGSALAFVFISNLIYLVPELQSGLLSVSAATPFALRAVLRGLLVPLIDAGTTGLVAASFWVHRRGIPVAPRFRWAANRFASVAVAGSVQVILGLGAMYAQSATTVILIYLGIGLVLLLWVRLALHTMMLAENGDVAHDSPVTA